MTQVRERSQADRMATILRRLSREGIASPWFVCGKGYDFPVATVEQMRWLNSIEGRWAEPKITLDEFLAANAASRG